MKLIKTLEKKLQLPIQRNINVLGIDTASRTGWCYLNSYGERLYENWGFIDIDTKNRYFKYNEIISIFEQIIKEDCLVIIEDTFFRFNPKMFRLISRIGAIAYTIAYQKGCPVRYMLATTARKNLGFKGNLKKKIFHQQFIKKLGLKIEDEDILDAMVLAYNGVINYE